MTLRLPQINGQGCGGTGRVIPKLTCQAGNADLCPPPSSPSLSLCLSTFTPCQPSFQELRTSLPFLVAPGTNLAQLPYFKAYMITSWSDKPIWVTVFSFLQDRVTFS